VAAEILDLPDELVDDDPPAPVSDVLGSLIDRLPRSGGPVAGGGPAVGLIGLSLAAVALGLRRRGR